MCGGLIWFAIVSSPLLFTFWNLVLFVEHSPLEDSSIVVAVGVNGAIFEVFVVDPINNWNSHDSVITIDRSKKLYGVVNQLQ